MAGNMITYINIMEVAKKTIIFHLRVEEQRKGDGLVSKYISLAIHGNGANRMYLIVGLEITKGEKSVAVVATKSPASQALGADFDTIKVEVHLVNTLLIASHNLHTETKVITREGHTAAIFDFIDDKRIDGVYQEKCHDEIPWGRSGGRCW